MFLTSPNSRGVDEHREREKEHKEQKDMGGEGPKKHHHLVSCAIFARYERVC